MTKTTKAAPEPTPAGRETERLIEENKKLREHNSRMLRNRYDMDVQELRAEREQAIREAQREVLEQALAQWNPKDGWELLPEWLETKLAALRGGQP